MNLQIDPTVATKISKSNQTAVPSIVRKTLQTKKEGKLLWRVNKKTKTVTIESIPENWGDRYYGIAKGSYGDIDKYIADLRKDRPLP